MFLVPFLTLLIHRENRINQPTFLKPNLKSDGLHEK